MCRLHIRVSPAGEILDSFRAVSQPDLNTVYVATTASSKFAILVVLLNLLRRTTKIAMRYSPPKRRRKLSLKFRISDLGVPEPAEPDIVFEAAFAF